MITILVVLAFFVLLLNAYIIYALQNITNNTIDKDDFLEYAKITKKKYDEMFAELQMIKKDIISIKSTANDTYRVMIEERIKRNEITGKIEEINEEVNDKLKNTIKEVEKVVKLTDKMAEEQAKLKASLLYYKKKYKQLKKQLKGG